jgi:hypothetical protein
MVEQVPGRGRYVSSSVADRATIEAAIARLDCATYGGLKIRHDEQGPSLTVSGCVEDGFLIGFHEKGQRLVAVEEPNAEGLIEMYVGNQEADYPRRELCDRTTLQRAMDGFLSSWSPSPDVQWEDFELSFQKAQAGIR